MDNAPYTGGMAPGAEIYAVDGDFTVLTPCGAPETYNPLPGDSVPYFFPIILLDRTLDAPGYVSVPLGTGFNVQTFAPTQTSVVIEQEFMIAESAYAPLPLNTPYNPAWSVGWANTYQNLENCFLVEEGPHLPVGAGIIRFTLKFASLPPNRNEFESYGVNFPALNYGASHEVHRFGLGKITNTRIFFEYFVFDEQNLLPSIGLFPGGHRLTSSLVATDAKYLCFEEFKGFKAEANSVNNNNLLDADQPLDDGDPPTTLPTVPSSTNYQSWCNTDPSEIVVEASSFNRWMGNIYVRRTRFALAE
jgi:hypothetical protein